MKNKILVIGLGNSILSDDAIGLHVAEQVRLRGPAGVEVVQSETAGYALLELMTGYERVILGDDRAHRADRFAHFAAHSLGARNRLDGGADPGPRAGNSDA